MILYVDLVEHIFKNNVYSMKGFSFTNCHEVQQTRAS